MSENEESNDELIKQLEMLDERIGVLQQQDKTKTTECVLCGLAGCDVISFEHRRPVHDQCLKSKG